MSDQVQTQYFVVTGRVQGVGFRWHCRQRAEQLGLRGWVENRPDGSVHGLLHGPQVQLELMQHWLRDGPPGARVDTLEIRESDEAAPDGFELR